LVPKQVNLTINEFVIFDVNDYKDFITGLNPGGHGVAINLEAKELLFSYTPLFHPIGPNDGVLLIEVDNYPVFIALRLNPATTHQGKLSRGQFLGEQPPGNQPRPVGRWFLFIQPSGGEIQGLLDFPCGLFPDPPPPREQLTEVVRRQVRLISERALTGVFS
jgi:hypothetical protein